MRRGAGPRLLAVPIRTNAVRTARRTQGLTQADVAIAAATGVRFVGDLERGKATCRLGETLRVLEALGLDVRLEQRA